MDEYLKDATPCTECGIEPTELVGALEPFIICGIPIGQTDYGTYLRCRKCGKRTVASSNIQDAYRLWNEKINII